MQGGEALRSLKAEALPYYERLLSEFEKSEYLAAAQKRVAELKGSERHDLAESR